MTKCKMAAETPNEAWLKKVQSEPQKSWNMHLIQEAKRGDTWRVQELLKLGASTRFRGESALKGAIENGHLHIVMQLMDLQNLRIAFVCDHMNTAISKRHYHIARHFTTHFNPPPHHQLDPDETHSNNLCVLAERGELPLLKLIVDKGINPLANNGVVFRSAAKMGQNHILDYLFEQGFDLEKDNNGAAILALNNQRYKTLDYLLNKGSDPNGEEHLMVKTALLYDHEKGLNILARHGADFSYDQHNPLYEAMRHGRNHCFNMLLSMGADTVLQYPKVLAQINQCGHSEIVKSVEDWQKNRITEHDFKAVTHKDDLLISASEGEDCLFIRAIKSNLLQPLCNHLQKRNIDLSIHDVCDLADKNGLSLFDLAYFRKGFSGLLHPHLWKGQVSQAKDIIADKLTLHQQRDPALQTAYTQLCLATSQHGRSKLQLRRRKDHHPKP